MPSSLSSVSFVYLENEEYNPDRVLDKGLFTPKDNTIHCSLEQKQK